ncbi:MAG TPA: alpha-E domain-containing protein, partial [Chloroflexota bacterium]|nr:alpha-E domain-containing protein [Chloroflexota bacterium]
MLSRVAEDLFWLSRYVERAVAVSRLIDVTLHLELDIGESEDSDLWAPLLGPAAAGGHLTLSEEGAHPSPRDIRRHLAFNAGNPNSLVSCVRRARAAARGVRESMSSEMWETLNVLYLSLVDPAQMAEAEASPPPFFRRVREAAQFFHGLADCTLVRDDAWYFLTLGKYLERADSVARVLYLQAHLLTPSSASAARSVDPTVRWLAVLRSCGSAEAYARYYALRVEPARVVEFLLLNPIFPQSVRFSLGAAWDALRSINERYSGTDEASSPE